MLLAVGGGSLSTQHAQACMHVQTATALIKLGFHYGRVPVAGRGVDVEAERRYVVRA